MNTLGENLVLLRTDRGYTRKDMETLLEVPWTTYRSWERNIYEPKLKYIVKLCTLFNVSSDELLGIKKIKESNLINKPKKDEIEDKK